MSSSTETFDPYLEWLEIQPHERPVDHYRLLGVARFEADAATITAAADERMRFVRSFQTGRRSKFTQQLLNELSTAKLCLLNPATKADYDAALQAVTAPVQDYGALPPPVAPPVLAGQAVIADPLPPPVAAQPQQVATRVASNVNRPEADDLEPRQSRMVLVGLVVGGIAVVAFSVWSIGQFASGGGDPPSDPVVDSATDQSTDDQPTDNPDVQNGPPKELVITQEGDGSVNFPAATAKVNGPAARLETQVGQQVVTNLTSPDDTIVWKFRVLRPAQFQAKIRYAAEKESDGSQYELLLNDQRLRLRDVIVTDPPGGESEDAFYVVVRQAGTHSLTLRPVKINGTQLMTFKSIRFEKE